jgi:ATP-dependent Zn protease
VNNFFKGFALWALVFMAVMFFVRQTQNPKTQTDLDYSQFLAQVQDGKIKDVVNFIPKNISPWERLWTTASLKS